MRDTSWFMVQFSNKFAALTCAQCTYSKALGELNNTARIHTSYYTIYTVRWEINQWLATISCALVSYSKP
jgi:hypothetical protein